MTPPPGLRYYPDDRPGITRRRHGRGFTYLAPDGTRVDDRTERQRIQALAVPPAYDDVWISPHRNGHLQATGRDARARKQYRYHPDWTEHRAQVKYADLAAFGAALPGIRRRILRGLSTETGEYDFALAAVLALIDRAAMRVGNRDYAEENGSYGATTLRRRHLRIDGDTIRLSYRAKGGRKVSKLLRDRTLHRALGRLHDLPGADLATWSDEDGQARTVTSDAVNAWLAEAVGRDGVTAKTFRTWHGSVAAVEAAWWALRHDEPVTIKAMSEAAAQRLANTAAIARSSYIHPAVIDLADGKGALRETPVKIAGLRLAERRLMNLIG